MFSTKVFIITVAKWHSGPAVCLQTRRNRVDAVRRLLWLEPKQMNNPKCNVRINAISFLVFDKRTEFGGEDAERSRRKVLWSTDPSCRDSVRIDRTVRKDWIFIASDFDESSISQGHFDEFPLKVELEAELVASRSSDVDDFHRVSVEDAFYVVSTWQVDLKRVLYKSTSCII